MKFSIFLMGDRTATYSDMADQVCLAEALDFHGIWLGERYFANGDLLWPSAMVAASYFAARTARIRIGLAARILPFHHPLHVAADTVTLDVLSNGRFDLGLSRGSMDEASHEAFQISREEGRQRFDEALEIVRLACSGRAFSFTGRHFDLPWIVPSPQPVQRPHPPFYMVANNPGSLDHAADNGYPVFLNGALTLRAAADSLARYRARAAAAGLADRTPDILMNRFVFVGSNTAEARERMRRPFLEFLDTRAPDLKGYLLKTAGEAGIDFDYLCREICIFGDADHCASRLLELRDRCRIDHVLCTFNLITLDHELCVESMQRFAREVVPRLRRTRRPSHGRALARGSAAMEVTEP